MNDWISPRGREAAEGVADRRAAGDGVSAHSPPGGLAAASELGLSGSGGRG